MCREKCIETDAPDPPEVRQVRAVSATNTNKVTYEWRTSEGEVRLRSAPPAWSAVTKRGSIDLADLPVEWDAPDRAPP